MKKILVPCDFSASAEKTFAVKIARQSGGEISVLFIRHKFPEK